MNGNARGEDNGDSANSCFLLGCPQSALPPKSCCVLAQVHLSGPFGAERPYASVLSLLTQGYCS